MRRLLAVVVVFLALTGQRCNFDSYAKRVIVSANDLQDAAARAYNEAKDQEQKAGKACAVVAREQGQAPSVEVCAALGMPIPYDPEKLAALAGPINAAYEAIRAANEIREAVEAGRADPTRLSEALAHATNALVRLYEAANSLGIRLDLSKAEALDKEVRG